MSPFVTLALFTLPVIFFRTITRFLFGRVISEDLRARIQVVSVTRNLLRKTYLIDVPNTHFSMFQLFNKLHKFVELAVYCDHLTVYNIILLKYCNILYILVDHRQQYIVLTETKYRQEITFSREKYGIQRPPTQTVFRAILRCT